MKTTIERKCKKLVVDILLVLVLKYTYISRNSKSFYFCEQNFIQIIIGILV